MRKVHPDASMPPSDRAGHWTAHRIIAHVKLCVLALTIPRMAELRAMDTRRSIADTLESQVASLTPRAWAASQR